MLKPIVTVFLFFCVYTSITTAPLSEEIESGSNKDSSLSDLEVVTYEYGKITSAYLPYGRKFIVRGKPIAYYGLADVVIIKINSDSENDPEYNYAGYWINPSLLDVDPTSNNGSILGVSSEVFQIFVDKPLKFGKVYNFTFNLYRRIKSENDDMTKEIVDKVMERAEQEFKTKGSLSNDQLKQFLKDVVKEKSDELSRESASGLENIGLGYLIFGEGEPIFKKGLAPEYSFPSGWENDFSLLAAERTMVEKCEEEKKKIKEENEKLSKEGKLENLIRNLKEARTKDNELSYSLDDVDRLRNFLVPQGEKNPVEPFMSVELEKENSETRNSLHSEYDAFINYNKEVEEAKKKINNITEKPTIRIEIGNAFSNAGSSQSESLAFPESTQVLESISVGTVYGIAYTALSPVENVEYEMFRYAGLKFFFGAVDKNLPKPYLEGAKSKLSFFIGIIANGNLTYRGLTLFDAAGTKPLLGISLEINRYIALDFGSVWFKQKSVSRVKSEERLRIAPYIGLSFDLDLLNNSRDMINKLLGRT